MPNEILVAYLALTGVVLNGLVALVTQWKVRDMNRELANRRGMLEEKLATGQRDLDEKLAAQRHDLELLLAERQSAFAKNLEEERRAHDVHLEEIRRLNQERIKFFEESLRKEFSQERLREMLEQENSRHLQIELRELNNVGTQMFSEFRGLASESDSWSDEELFKGFSVAIKVHQEFKLKLKGLNNLVPADDYLRFDSFQKYLVVVLLDIARKQDERKAKAGEMQAHVEKIVNAEKEFNRFMRQFLQTTVVDKSSH